MKDTLKQIVIWLAAVTTQIAILIGLSQISVPPAVWYIVGGIYILFLTALSIDHYVSQRRWNDMQRFAGERWEDFSPAYQEWLRKGAELNRPELPEKGPRHDDVDR